MTLGAYVDDFYVDSTLWFAGRPQRAFRLSRGFLTAAPLLTYASTFEALVNGPSTPFTSTDYVMDLEAGLVNVVGLDLSCRHLRASYNAGFDPDPNENGQYDPADVPDWLQRAACLPARLALNDQPFLSDGDDTPTTKAVEDMRAHIIASKALGWMDTLDPLTKS